MDTSRGDDSMSAHIDAFFEYDQLVGESDGGVALSEKAYVALQRKAAAAAEDRLFCTWRHGPTGQDCINVGPSTRCLCGHTYKSHAWFETMSKKVTCRCPGCKCPGFRYVSGRGSQFLRCGCRHGHEDHRNPKGDGRMGPCAKGSCSCKGYAPTARCACGAALAFAMGISNL
jgi:hypothetical protein